MSKGKMEPGASVDRPSNFSGLIVRPWGPVISG